MGFLARGGFLSDTELRILSYTVFYLGEENGEYMFGQRQFRRFCGEKLGMTKVESNALFRYMLENKLLIRRGGPNSFIFSPDLVELP